MRSEEFERIRRRLKAGAALRPPAGEDVTSFDEARPWNSVFLISVHSGDVESSSFWNRKVREKAMLFLARIRAP
eukprot:3981825-Alexandrium_andersonii.AAC.1